MAAITLDRLRKHFGRIEAVRDISVTFADGELTSVLGPSGCGKTTTLNMIAGFIEPDSGSILFGDRIVSDPVRHIFVPPHRRNLGMVFQSYALWPHLTIGENVGYGLKMRGIGRHDRDRMVQSSLARVRLDGYFDRYPHELSGGQQQRVALARAIAYAPQILLFDEPLSNLDAQLREEMRNELKRLHDEIGVTAVYVTHDQSEAMTLSHTIIVMGGGRILQRGTPLQLYEEPESVQVATFIGTTNLLEASLLESNGRQARVKVEGVDGILPCRAPEHAAKVAGSLSIRPEGIALRPAMSRTEGIIGRVSSVTYLGDIARYEVQVGDSRLLKAQQSTAELLRIGDPVLIELDPQKCYFIADRDAVPARKQSQ